MKKSLMDSMGYEICRYFIPTSILASRTLKAAASAPRKTVTPTKLTYTLLIDGQQKLIELGQISQQTFANRATALRKFLTANHLNESDVVGMEMRPHYPMAVEKLVEKLRNEGKGNRAISNTTSALSSWKKAVVSYDTEVAYYASQPTPFLTLLKSVLLDQQVSKVARQSGVPIDMLTGWLKGKSPRKSNAKYISRIEVFFGLERHSLIGLAGFSLDAREKADLPSPIAVEFRERQRERRKDAYYLEVPIDSPLRKQWREFMKYKTDLVPQLERTKRGLWTFSSLDAIRETECRWFQFLDGIEVPSALAAGSKVLSYLGFLGLPPEQGGLGIAHEKLQTLAWLVVPTHIEKYLNWVKKRADGKTSNGAIQFIATVNMMVRPEWGYLAQQPHFLATLPEEFHVQDWSLLCKTQFKYLNRLEASEVDPGVRTDLMAV